jgi:AcrR family transcriptional regulator
MRKTSAADAVLDNAMALFAVQGIDKTTLGDVADASGLSKAGVLYHYPTMAGLRDAADQRARQLVDDLVESVRAMPVGRQRDRRVIMRLVDDTLAYPGATSFTFKVAAPYPAQPLDHQLIALEAHMFQAFEDDPDSITDARRVRLTGVFVAAIFLGLRSLAFDTASEWRPLILEACFNLLDGEEPVLGW